MDIFEQVKKILCDQLDLEEEQVNEDSEVIDDLGADSLDIVDLVMTLEEEFDTEIPDEDIRKLNVPHGYGYSEPSRDQQQYPPRRSEPRAYTVSAPEPRPAPPAAKPAASAAPSFAVGDRVVHKAFGDGVVAAVKPMGGDALLEVDFESAGTKRLMMRAAGQFMKKKD